MTALYKSGCVSAWQVLLIALAISRIASIMSLHWIESSVKPDALFLFLFEVGEGS
uniref:Uncharacterized protein n=1 Tax=Triticum urartu TaxID=4572 RepID=A0A8R7U8J6_TRIUA